MAGFLRSRFVKVATGVIVLPAVGVGGLTAYVRYRRWTRPAPHTFKPLVDEQGNLKFEGKVVPRPPNTSLALRAVHLFCIFAPVAFLYLFMCWNASLFHRWLELLLSAVQRAGPVFVKIGQWSCTREDLFSPAVRRVFKRLYNEVSIHPFSDTMQILEEELGKDPLTVFDSIESKTVGSGSIGQVHLARLRDSDRKVVIKVMHPHIVETIVRDFTLLGIASETLDKYCPSLERFEIPTLCQAFSSHLAAQLDFRVEAENLEQFRSNFKNESYVEFPEPLMSTQRMLVETFCVGEPANPEFLASLPSHARDVLATNGLNAWCKMLLRDNFIHGDMHPGNILIDVTDPHVPTITLIDVGLCQQLTPEQGAVTHDLMESFVRWKSTLCVSSLLAMGGTQKFVDREKFTTDMEKLFSGFRPARNDQQAVTNILQSIFESVRDNHVQMDPPYVSLLFAVLVLEGFIMNLNPEFNMVRHAAPWLVSEGHVSKGVLKNLAKTQWDNLKKEYGIMTGRMEDSMVLEELEGQKNVRISSTW